MAVWKVWRSTEARTGIRGENIGKQQLCLWDIRTHYIAQAAIQATVAFRPDVIVFGGGVMSAANEKKARWTVFVRNSQVLLNGYLPVPDVRDGILWHQL